MGNAVVHFEIGGPDDKPLIDFYGQLFGWDLQPFSGGGYTMIDTRGGGGINGGIGKSQTGEPWSTFYVGATDLQAVLDKANSLGGSTVLPVTDFGGAVTVAMFNDPDGLLVGLVQVPEAAQGADAPPGPSVGQGEPVDWFEVLGSDPQRTQRFYAELFGWQVSASQDGASQDGASQDGASQDGASQDGASQDGASQDGASQDGAGQDGAGQDGGGDSYAMVDTGAGSGIQGGLGSGDQAQRWATIYASVPDVEQTLAMAEKLGGSRVYGPMAVDDHMQTGALRDPAGNVFGVYHHGEH